MAELSKALRQQIYRRDGWQCALCDSQKYIQVHHYIHRGQGGSNSPHNLITLCMDCHALAHGMNLRDWQDITKEDIEQAIVEYLEDMYLEDWNPWRRE